MGDLVEIRDLPRETDALLRSVFKGHAEGFAQFGAARYVLPASYKEHADALRRMPLRADDIWVVTYPRCGTTWTQEMVWLLKNNLDYEGAKTQLWNRYYFIELFAFLNEQRKDIGSVTDSSREPIEHVMRYLYKTCEDGESPRFFKTHLPLSLLPPSVLDTCKVVYVARDPRDVAISFYHLSQMFNFMDYVGDFKSYWKLFIEDLVPYTPFMAHLKEAWNLRNHPNMMFLFYQDMIKDLPSVARQVSAFLGKKYSSEEIKKLCVHLHVDNFKHNEAVNPSWMKKSHFVNEGSQSFVRKGEFVIVIQMFKKTISLYLRWSAGTGGGWRDYFDEEMLRQADRWLEEHLAGSGLQFPQPAP